MPPKLKVAFFLPAVPISSDCLVEVVDAVLDREDTEVFSFEQTQFDEMSIYIRDLNYSVHGFYWETYEEDWIETPLHLIDFAQSMEGAAVRSAGTEHEAVFRKLAAMAREAARRGVPLCSQT